MSSLVFKVETKEAEVAENPAEELASGSAVEKDEIKNSATTPHQQSSTAKTDSTKSETVKSNSTHVPSIQEPLLKSEPKEEETIHDSDFEEPSGRIVKNNISNKYNKLSLKTYHPLILNLQRA